MSERTEVVARTAFGELGGVRHGGVCVFRNVPYAAPPTGRRRFAAPESPAHWGERRDARLDGPVAPQLPSRLRLVMGDFTAPQDEDCLTLTVWTPGTEAARRPVLVWFHGGGYSSGAGSLPWYSGATLAREGDLVVVGVNYRLGALGFLHVPGLVPGNLGLLDQEAALRWVVAHIADFGGDPGNVTAAGQSAGAYSIAALLAMPSARGLFRRAILQSGPFSILPQTTKEAIRVGRALLKELNVDPDRQDALQKLHAAPVATILAAQGAVARAEARPGVTAPPFFPVGDGTVLPEPAAFQAAVDAGIGTVDAIIGTAREEMGAFFAFDPAIQALDEETLVGHARRLRGPAAETTLKRLRRRRPGAANAAILGDLVTEHDFLAPSLALAEHAAAAGRRVHLYRFDWPSPHRPLGACHCIELPFMFGSLGAWNEAPMLAGADTAEIAALSESMRGAWIAFARTGDPNTSDGPWWPPYDTDRRRTMCFDTITAALGDPAGRDEMELSER